MPDRADRRRFALVGRAEQRDALDRALTLSTGGFTMLVLVGDAGAGKSRLAAAFAADHTDTVTVLSARAHRLGSTSPFGVWSEALDRELGSCSPRERERLCAGVQDDLAGLLRSLPRPEEATSGPARPLDGLAGLVRALAARRPVVLVVDDLPLADASSLTALHALAHRCADDPVLVVGTARPDELAERIEAVRMLVGLEQDGTAQRLEIGPLDTPSVRELAAQGLGRPAPEPLVDWLSDRARGNPLDTLDLLDGLIEEGADLSRPALRRLPDSLADRVALRLSGLDPAALEVVEMLAVIGRRAELRSVVALSGRSPAELVGVLERLARARLVTEDDEGPELTVEITHPLVADAVYERMGLARRRWQHREVARVLVSLGRGGEAAGHFVRSADPGDDEAIVALRDAVHAAEEGGAFREALTMLAELVTLLPAGDPRWADVVDALRWDAQWVVDHRADSHAALGVPALRAMDAALAGLDDPARRAPVKLRLATFVGWGDGTLAEAEQLCSDAVTLFEQAGDRRGVLFAEHELAWLSGFSRDIALLDAQARRVAEAARAAGDEVVLSRAMRSVALMALFRGRPGDAREAFAHTAATAGADPHRQTLGVGGLAMSAVMAGHGGEAAPFLGRLRLGHAAESADYIALLSWWTGDLVALRAATRNVAGIGATPASRRLGGSLFYAALAAVEVGSLTEAKRYAARLRAVFGDSGWVLYVAMADHADALVGWGETRAAESVPLLREAARTQLRGEFLMGAVLAFVDLAEIAARAGVPAPDAEADLAGIAERTGLEGFRGLAELATGWGAHARGDLAAGRDHARRAAAALGGWAFQHARAMHLVARCTERRDDAVAALTEAAALFDACGATVRRDEAVDELAALGSQGRRAAAAAQGPDSLTAREREVAALAATGLSAREIGAELFIGERTVEGHLARAYARLGIRSKVELARRADELGLRTRTRTGTPDRTGPAS